MTQFKLPEQLLDLVLQSPDRELEFRQGDYIVKISLTPAESEAAAATNTSTSDRTQKEGDKSKATSELSQAPSPSFFKELLENFPMEEIPNGDTGTAGEEGEDKFQDYFNIAIPDPHGVSSTMQLPDPTIYPIDDFIAPEIPSSLSLAKSGVEKWTREEVKKISSLSPEELKNLLGENLITEKLSSQEREEPSTSSKKFEELRSPTPTDELKLLDYDSNPPQPISFKRSGERSSSSNDMAPAGISRKSEVEEPAPPRATPFSKGRKGAYVRLLRASDTPWVLRKLFERESVPISKIKEYFKLPEQRVSIEELAEAAGIVEFYPELIPFVDSPDSEAEYRIVCRRDDNSFVLLVKSQSSQALSFIPLSHVEVMPQIALIEGESLLSEEELKELFARYPKEGDKKAKAIKVAEKIGKNLAPKSETKRGKVPHTPSLSMPKTKSFSGVEKSIPVDDRLLKRFDYQRTHNEKGLWDSTIQEGVSIFKDNIATLFVDNKPIIEGILLYLIKQKQYLIFDRRHKRSVVLEPNIGQRLWLRRDDK